MKKHFIIILAAILLVACSQDSEPTSFFPDEEGSTDTPPDTTSTNETNLAGEVTVFQESKMDNSILLVNDAINNRVYLMDKTSEILHEWELESGLGNDCLLLENGQLLALLEAGSPKIDFGGFGGNLQLINPDNSIEWEYLISDENFMSHHDVEMLPNGNILILVWVKKTAEEALKAGFKYDYDIFPESVFELDPKAMQIVWRWNSWDHLVQDHDETKENFGAIADNPHKININFNPIDSGDIMHANGIGYDSHKDLIYISVNFYSEIWVIDHSTTEQEARENRGGNYNKGGDLVYRFGNPSTYDNGEMTRLFYNNHYPNINNSQNTMFMFMNGNSLGQSIVYEFNLPQDFSIGDDPEILWHYTHPDLYSQKVSGATELPNGNIFITEGDFGAWEVTREGEIVWQFKAEGFFWRIYPYEKSNPALDPFNL